MDSNFAPWTHTAVTQETQTVEFGATGCTKHNVTVPKGTACRKLAGEGSNQWVVADISFIEDKRSMLYSDADIYGIRIPEEKLEDIAPVSAASRPKG